MFTPRYPMGSVSDLLTQGCDHMWPLCISMNHFCTDGVYTPGYDPISPEARLQTLIPTPWYPRGSVSDLLTQGCDHIWPLCIVMGNFCTDGVYTLGYVSQYKINDFSYTSHVMKRFGLRSHVTLTRDRVHNYVHMTREWPCLLSKPKNLQTPM